MKTELVSARFPKEDTALLNEVSKEEKTDKTTALRKIFAMGAKQYKLERAVKQYQAGRIGIGKAAEMAGMSLWELMDELKTRNISSALTGEEYQEGLRNLKKAWK